MGPMAEQIHDIGRRRAWVIWLAASRSTSSRSSTAAPSAWPGCSPVSASGSPATQLAVFTVLQLVVYAGLQVPIGVLLDRYGSRVLLLGGLVLMTVGQLAFAFATSFPLAVLARALSGRATPRSSSA